MAKAGDFEWFYDDDEDLVINLKRGWLEPDEVLIIEKGWGCDPYLVTRRQVRAVFILSYAVSVFAEISEEDVVVIRSLSFSQLLELLQQVSE